MAGFGRCLRIKRKEESIHENSVVFARSSQIWKFHVDNQILLSLRFLQRDPTTDQSTTQLTGEMVIKSSPHHRPSVIKIPVLTKVSLDWSDLEGTPSRIIPN
jgi:hypothetical protein